MFTHENYEFSKQNEFKLISLYQHFFFLMRPELGGLSLVVQNQANSGPCDVNFAVQTLGSA